MTDLPRSPCYLLCRFFIGLPIRRGTFSFRPDPLRSTSGVFRAKTAIWIFGFLIIGAGETALSGPAPLYRWAPTRKVLVRSFFETVDRAGPAVYHAADPNTFREDKHRGLAPPFGLARKAHSGANCWCVIPVAVMRRAGSAHNGDPVETGGLKKPSFFKSKKKQKTGPGLNGGPVSNHRRWEAKAALGPCK